MNEITKMKLNSNIEKQWYNVTELALYLGLTEPSIRAKLARGEIEFSKYGKRVLIKRDIVENLVGNSPN